MSETRKPASLADIVSTATRAERTVTVCVAGKLNNEYERLERRLTDATRQTTDSLAGATTNDARRIAEQMETLRGQMREHEHEFTFRALPPKQWSDLTAQHPPREGHREAFNADTFPQACLAACLVAVNGVEQPVDEASLTALWEDVLNVGQRGELFDAAWEANTGRVHVPFSALASATLKRTVVK